MDAAKNNLLLALEQAQKEGKVLDVSAINTGNMFMIDPPADKSVKKWLDAYPYIVSDNYEGYRRAFEILGPELKEYADAYYNEFVKTPTPQMPGIPQPVMPVAKVAAPVAKTPGLRFQTAVDQAMQAGKIVDVSKLTADGKGYRTKKYPTKATTTKRWIENMPVVSNNYATYLLAMQMLGAEYVPYAEHFKQRYGVAPIAKVGKAAKAKEVTGAFPGVAPAVITLAPGQIGVAAKVKTPKVRTPKAKSPKPVAILQVGQIPQQPMVMIPQLPQQK